MPPSLAGSEGHRRIRLNVSALAFNEDEAAAKFLVVMDEHASMEELVAKVQQILGKQGLNPDVEHLLNSQRAILPRDETVGDVLHDREEILALPGFPGKGGAGKEAPQAEKPAVRTEEDASIDQGEHQLSRHFRRLGIQEQEAGQSPRVGGPEPENECSPFPGDKERDGELAEDAASAYSEPAAEPPVEEFEAPEDLVKERARLLNEGEPKEDLSPAPPQEEWIQDRKKRRLASMAMKERLVKRWLAKYGFRSLNEKKRTGGICFSHSVYPLHAAVEQGDLKAVQMLLLARADPALQDSDKRTPLEHAQELSQVRHRKRIIAALKTFACDE